MRKSSFEGIAVAAVLVVFLALLPFLLIVVPYTFFTIYGMTKGTTFGAESVNVGVIFTGVAAITALLVCLLGIAVWGIDRAMGPSRKDRGAED
jgi:hypothetical protein